MKIYKRTSGKGFVTESFKKINLLLELIPENSDNIKIFVGNNNGFHSFDYFFFATFENTTLSISEKMDKWDGTQGKVAKRLSPSKFSTIENELNTLAAELWFEAVEMGVR